MLEEDWRSIEIRTKLRVGRFQVEVIVDMSLDSSEWDCSCGGVCC